MTPASKELVDALIDARLLISSSEGQGEPVISLAHEALLEFWPRLAEWREKNRENLHIHARLTRGEPHVGGARAQPGFPARARQAHR